MKIADTQVDTQLVKKRLSIFLQSLPDESVSQDWLRSFQSTLMGLLPGIDRIVLSIDRNAPLIQLAEDCQDVSVMYLSHKGQDLTKFTALRDIGQYDRSRRLILALNEWGLDFSKYHSPIVQEYHVDNVYVGSIVLLRERGHCPISLSTLALLANLKTFIVYLFSNCIIRHQVKYPETRLTGDIISKIGSAPKYSDQDTSILTLLLYGYSYKEAAASLDISIDTVKKHVKKIYSHERVGSLSELWAKYITFQESSEIKQQKTPERANVTRGKGTQRGTVPEPTGAVHLHQ